MVVALRVSRRPRRSIPVESGPALHNRQGSASVPAPKRRTNQAAPARAASPSDAPAGGSDDAPAGALGTSEIPVGRAREGGRGKSKDAVDTGTAWVDRWQVECPGMETKFSGYGEGGRDSREPRFLLSPLGRPALWRRRAEVAAAFRLLESCGQH